MGSMKSERKAAKLAAMPCPWVICVLYWLCLLLPASGIGANWGTQASHPLPPDGVVQMLRENGFRKVKLFDAEEGIMNALKKSGLEVMVGIPNDMLASLATNMKAAQDWVSTNVSSYINDGVNVRYVAVGNEPFLQTYNGSFLSTTFPALQNIQSSLIKAGLSSQVKTTIPLNADVYQSSNSLPSGGDFRADIRDLMLQIVKYLSDNGGPFTVNIYPFISLYNDPNFPVEFAFFDGGATPINDGGIQYTNVLDANHDTLVWALRKNGFANLPIVIGEIGWPTDGDMNANLAYAQKFNQGIIARLLGGKGTPLRPGPLDAYLFSLIDEDQKSIQPGNFERHWGFFNYDGTPKYPLTVGSNTVKLAQVKNIKYLQNKWCVMKNSAKLDDSQLPPSVSYACSRGDCTTLGYKTSCGGLDVRGNISYAFNSYYQINDQDDLACKFSGLATVTDKDPSTGTCKFNIMIDVESGATWNIIGVGGGIIRLLFFVYLPYLLTFL